MVAVNEAFQSGHARAFIEHTPWDGSNRLFLMHEGHNVTYDPKGGLVFTPMAEGTAPSPGDALMAWSDVVEDTLIDMFKATAKALEIYSDEPGKSYKQGYAEGKAEVLREWNNELKEQNKDLLFERAP